MLKGQEFILHSVDDSFGDIHFDLSATNPIDYKIEFKEGSRERELQITVYYGATIDVINYTLGETPVITTSSENFSKPTQKKIAEDRKLFNMNHWSDIMLLGKKYSIFYNTVGYFLLDPDDKLVGKFYSDVPPPLNADGVLLGGDPIQYSDTEVYVPFLISDLSDENILGINLLK